MRIIYNRILPFGRRYYAINLFGVLFAKGPCGPITLNHEKIHSAQMKELGYLFFYIFYILEWLVRFIQYGDNFKAYRNISYEREAYAQERDMDYLRKRRRYSFLKYMKIKKSNYESSDSKRESAP